jgi:hypothetical protein
MPSGMNERKNERKSMERKLTKARMGQNRVYRLFETGVFKVICTRINKRDYVACSADGSIWYVDRKLAEKDAKDRRRQDVVFLTE